MTCPEPETPKEIKKSIHDIKLTLYGEDGLGGIVSCMKNKVSRKTIIAFLCVALGLCGTPIFTGIIKAERNKDSIVRNDKNISLVQKDVEEINKNIDKVSKSVEDLKSDVTKKIDDGLEQINKSIKKLQRHTRSSSGSGE